MEDFNDFLKIDENTTGANLAPIYPSKEHPFPLVTLETVIASAVKVKGVDTMLLKFLFKNKAGDKFHTHSIFPVKKGSDKAKSYYSLVVSTVKEIYDACALCGGEAKSLEITNATGWEDFCNKVVLAFNNGRGKDLPIYKIGDKHVELFIKLTIALNYPTGGIQLGKSPFIQPANKPVALVIVPSSESIDISILSAPVGGANLAQPSSPLGWTAD